MTARTRVAILGGGAGSMTAAFYLSNTPELRERFEVTVYQTGDKYVAARNNEFGYANYEVEQVKD